LQVCFDSSTVPYRSIQWGIQAELEDVRRELDLQLVENETLKSNLKSAQARFEASREIQVTCTELPSIKQQ
jgi:hypothetical protein